MVDFLEGFKKRTDTNFIERFEECSRLEGKDKNACLHPLLHDVTKLQDILNLSLDVSVNYSTQLARNMVDYANAIILGVTSKRGDIRPVLEHGYVDEKIGHVVHIWNCMANDYNLTLDDPGKFIPKKKLTTYLDRKGRVADKKVRDYNINQLFR